jgi:uncharacterized membrane protein YkgB
MEKEFVNDRPVLSYLYSLFIEFVNLDFERKEWPLKEDIYLANVLENRSNIYLIIISLICYKINVSN